jgi:Zn2+/Cd2+-exporting ATPase
VPVERLRVGDIVVVRPGDRAPSDGEVIEGQSEVDEAPVTGESVPVAKGVGDQVYAGSINANGMLRVRITHPTADNTIARIIHLVEEAQGSKAPTARFIDRFAAYYTPAAMAVAALIVVGPPLAAGTDWYTWIYRGLATLLIACPCALVISTPAAIASERKLEARLFDPPAERSRQYQMLGLSIESKPKPACQNPQVSRRTAAGMAWPRQRCGRRRVSNDLQGRCARTSRPIP